jgi:hypothetical protein
MPSEDISGYKTFTFGFTAALKIRGPQALVNRWAKTFMTPKGSDLLHPDYGTEFGDLAGSNIVSDYTELQDTAIMSIDDASDQVREQDAVGLLDANESLESAELVKFVPLQDGFELWVLLVNKAQQSLPLKLTLMATR